MNAIINAQTIENLGLDKAKRYLIDATDGSIFSCDKVEFYSWHHPEYHDEERKTWLSIEMKNEVKGWGTKKVKITGLDKEPLPFKRHEMSRHILDSTTVQRNYRFSSFRNLQSFFDKI